MLATVHAGTLVGVDAAPVRVEVDLVKGLPGFDIIGLAETAVRESRFRVRAALEASGFAFPNERVLVNLAPGDLRKHGTLFDLAIAVAVLAASGACARRDLGHTLVIGELSLSGEVRPVRGVLAQLLSAERRGLSAAIVPDDHAGDAALASGLTVLVAHHLTDVVDHLDGRTALEPVQAAPQTGGAHDPSPDLSDVRGQLAACRALEIAAAGGHHLLLLGPPGAGKTMLARRLPALLPPPSPAEALEIATIAGASGLPVPKRDGKVARPFRAPHHTASTAALVGGGDPVRPGEVTVAHGGVLFLDELPEFRREAVESLRVTMETGVAHVVRVRQRAVMPARSLVVAAMNPCPCGFAGDTRRVCACSPERVARYGARVSGPLLDRFDMHVRVPRVQARALRRGAQGETTSSVRQRVIQARQRAAGRGGLPDGLAVLGRNVAPEALSLLDRAMDALGLSARGYVKALKVARTIADLDGKDEVSAAHLAEAVQYRLLDRRPATRPATQALTGPKDDPGHAARQGGVG